MKPYYRIKGTYSDGRMKVVIEKREKKKIISKTLPKPEILWQILGQVRNEQILKGIKDT